MSVRRVVQIGVSAVALALGGLVVVPGAAQAVPPNLITVGPGCSLDSAIFSAQLDASFGSCTAGESSRRDVIQLPPGTYGGPFVIPSSFAPLEILGQPGEESTTILDGDGTGTTLTIDPQADVQLTNVTVTGGQGAAGADGITTGAAGGDGGAGAIDNAGSLRLTTVLVHGNAGGVGGAGDDVGGVRDAGGPGGAGGPGAVRNAGALVLEGATLLSDNDGGDGGPGGRGGSALCIPGHVGGSQPYDYARCVYSAGAAGRGGAGGAGGVQSTGPGARLSMTAATGSPISGDRGGDGGAGGQGGNGDALTVDGDYACRPGADGGRGGDGGPGGLYVGDDTQVLGDVGDVTGGTGGTGATGGPGGTGGCGPGVVGPDGDDGQSDIRRGAQTLSWTTAPPDSEAPGAAFTPTAGSTSGLAPVISVQDDCSLDSSTGEVTLAGSVGSCTVDADEAGNAFFLAATRLSKTVSITDSTAPVITPNVVGTLGSEDWYVSDVTLTWTVTDPDSDVTSTTGCDEVDITADQASTPYTCEATSAGGTHSASVSIKRDVTAPTVTPSITPSPVLLGGSAVLDVTVVDDGSGVDSSTTQCGAVSSSAVGTFTVACSASDRAGNASGDVGVSYTVAAPFGSFLTPLPRSTYSKSGSVIPVKFTLRNAGGALPAAVAGALAANGQVRAILTQAADGSGTRLATALCAWDATRGNFVCNLKSPKLKSVANPYYITVQEAGVAGSSWFKPPDVSGATGAALNPVPIGFK